MPYKEIGEGRRKQREQDSSIPTDFSNNLDAALVTYLASVFRASFRPELSAIASQVLNGQSQVMDLDTATQEAILYYIDEDDPRSRAAAAQHGIRIK